MKARRLGSSGRLRPIRRVELHMRTCKAISSNAAATAIATAAEVGPRLNPDSGTAHRTGLLLADVNFKSIYANHAAVQILSYPGQSHTTGGWADTVQVRIRSILQAERFSTHIPATSFLSGRRRYICRPFLLESCERPSLVALLLERRLRDAAELSEMSRRYHLSPREFETVQHLIHGLTTKEVAQRMSVSPNTVKQFVRLTMSKMGVTTRSGVIGVVMGG